jgi:hypothetical protein
MTMTDSSGRPEPAEPAPAVLSARTWPTEMIDARLALRKEISPPRHAQIVISFDQARLLKTILGVVIPRDDSMSMGRAHALLEELRPGLKYEAREQIKRRLVDEFGDDIAPPNVPLLSDDELHERLRAKEQVGRRRAIALAEQDLVRVQKVGRSLMVAIPAHVVGHLSVSCEESGERAVVARLRTPEESGGVGGLLLHDEPRDDGKRIHLSQVADHMLLPLSGFGFRGDDWVGFSLVSGGVLLQRATRLRR